MDKQQVLFRRAATVALFTALLWLASLISISVTGGSVTPFTLQTLFVLLVGLRLPPVWSLQCLLLYLLLGALGLPVFAGGSGGLAVLLGATAGYLWGFPLQAVTLSYLVKKMQKLSRWYLIFAIFFVLPIPYLTGVPWLKLRLQIGWSEAFSIGMLPFLPGAVIKGVVALFFAPQLIRARQRQGGSVARSVALE